MRAIARLIFAIRAIYVGHPNNEPEPMRMDRPSGGRTLWAAHRLISGVRLNLRMTEKDADAVLGQRVVTSVALEPRR